MKVHIPKAKTKMKKNAQGGESLLPLSFMILLCFLQKYQVMQCAYFCSMFFFMFVDCDILLCRKCNVWEVCVKLKKL